MADETKHTPTPWKVQAHPNTGFLNSLKAGRATVAETVRDADAAFVVRAVNSHAALVSTLKCVLREANARIANDPEWWAMVDKAEAALKLAGEP